MPTKKSFLLRLDPELFDEIQAWAADELRSVNGQIEYLLVSAIRARRRKDHGPLGDPGERNAREPER